MSEQKIVLFRVDGNGCIGMGHVMRCLSLADELKDRCYRIIFVVSDCSVVNLIKKRGFETTVLNSNWNNYCDKINELKEYVTLTNASWLITDSYYVTDSYFEIIDNCRLAWITENRPPVQGPNVDLFINYNLYMSDYTIESTACKLCLGSRYALIRKMFKNVSTCNGNDILILTGGSDTFGIAENISKAMMQSLDGAHRIVVVSGSLNPNLSKLKSLSKNITLLIDVEDMVSVMMNARIAISAGGSTLYELAACGVPTITFSFVDNQLENVNAFSKKGIMPYAGDFRRNKESVVARIVQLAKRYYHDDELRKEVAKQMRSICDGCGASRVADIIDAW